MFRKIREPLNIEKYAIQLRHRPRNLVHIRHCPRCSHKITSPDANYCPVCGNHSLLRGKATEMLYNAIKLNENGKALVCPHCSNEELTPGDFCMICGNGIINRCADMQDPERDNIVSKGCRTVLPGNARYCFKCGNESTFYQKGWLKDWRCENTKKAIENIKVAVDFDELKESRTSV